MPSLFDPRMLPTEENTYTPTGRDIENLSGGLLSGLLGYPGDIQELARQGGNAALGLLSGVNPVARQLAGLGGLLQARAPTSEEVGAAIGADPTTGAFMAGTIGAPDPQDIGRGLLSMTLFHGTPHKFSKFDLSKIGTGEGKQAFGHGLYFAENPGVAGTYRQPISRSFQWEIDGNTYHGMTTRSDTGPHNIAANALERFDGDKQAAIDWLEDWGQDADAKEILRNAKSIKKSEGHLYEVEIPDETIDKMLDWDAPLSEQPESVRRVLSDLNKKYPGLTDDVKATSYGPPSGEPDGQEILSRLQEIMEDEVLDELAPQNLNPRYGSYVKDAEVRKSKVLNELGIPGIRFLDGSSRTHGGKKSFMVKVTQDPADGGYTEYLHYPSREAAKKAAKETGGELIEREGTRNIVVFNPDDITQVKRDGEEVFRKGLLANVEPPLTGQAIDSIPSGVRDRHAFMEGLTAGRAGDASSMSDNPDYWRGVVAGAKESGIGSTRTSAQRILSGMKPQGGQTIEGEIVKGLLDARRN